MSVASVILSLFVARGLLDHNSPEDDYDEWRRTVLATPLSFSPQWTPGGGHILFTKLNNPDAARLDDGLYRIELDGSRIELVAERARWLSISSDGLRIAYATTRDHQRLPYYIETAWLDGSDRRRLAEQAFKNHSPGLSHTSPAWSPDGQRIAFARFTPWHTEGSGIYIMDTDGSNLSWLFRFNTGRNLDNRRDEYRWGPIWSPDGKKLAFGVQEFTADSTNGSVNRWVLYTINPNGSNVSRVFAGFNAKTVRTGGPQIDRILGMPAWSTDGRKLAFIRHVSSDYKDSLTGEVVDAPLGTTLNTINSDGSGLQIVANLGDIDHANSLSWSPNGNEILFTLCEGPSSTIFGCRLYIAATDEFDNYHKVADAAFASWSPGGSRIAVAHHEYNGVVHDLSTMAPDGSDVRILLEGTSR